MKLSRMRSKRSCLSLASCHLSVAACCTRSLCKVRGDLGGGRSSSTWRGAEIGESSASSSSSSSSYRTRSFLGVASVFLVFTSGLSCGGASIGTRLMRGLLSFVPLGRPLASGCGQGSWSFSGIVGEFSTIVGAFSVIVGDFLNFRRHPPSFFLALKN